MQSESAIGAVPAAADTWTDINTFTVPAGVKRLKKVSFGIAPDPGALAQIHVLPIIRLTGSGLLEQSPHVYAGQGVTQSITAANSGSAPVQPEVMSYDVDIPVQTGGQITVQIDCLDEIPAAMTSRVNLEYDEKDPQAGNNMSDWVDAVPPAAAGAWTAVGTLTVPQLAAGNNPTKIKEIVCGRVPDVAGNVLIRNSARFRLTGSGLKEGGNHHFLGNELGIMWTTPGAQFYDKCLRQIKDLDIAVNPGGQILVEAIADVEIPEGGTDIFLVRYA